MTLFIVRRIQSRAAVDLHIPLVQRYASFDLGSAARNYATQNGSGRGPGVCPLERELSITGLNYQGAVRISYGTT